MITIEKTMKISMTLIKTTTKALEMGFTLTQDEHRNRRSSRELLQRTELQKQ